MISLYNPQSAGANIRVHGAWKIGHDAAQDCVKGKAQRL